ncbi:MAG: hypothetical protein RBU21_01585 [FCB group bacterium]|jgi:hypothetical protein|nr:hypothetical protein [FCB group bacterium]
MRARPASVQIGLALLSLEVLLKLWIFISIPGAQWEHGLDTVAYQAVPLLVSAGTLGFLWCGRGWARGGIVLLLGHDVYRLAQFVLHFRVEMLAVFAFWWILRVLVNSVSLALLFRQDSREWFAHSLAARIERRTGIPPEDQAGLPRRYWGAFALGALALGWGPYPVFIVALIMFFNMLEQIPENFVVRVFIIVVFAGVYSGLFFAIGTALGWIFDTVRGANHPKPPLTQQRVE